MKLYLALTMSAFALIGCNLSENSSNVMNSSQDQQNLEPVAAITSSSPFGAMGAKKESNSKLASMKVSLVGATANPSSVDLTSKFPTPGNQGSQGSCVGWAIAYAAKTYQEAKEEGWNHTGNLRRFSPAYIYNQINGGVDQGSFPTDALNLLVNKGVDNLEFMPYNAADFTTQPTDLSNARASRYKAKSYSVLSTATDAKTALAAGRPVVIAINIYPDFAITSTNQVYNNSSGTLQGRHMLALVGYNDNFKVGTTTVPSFKFINSWGTSWGLSGYGWIAASMLSDSKVEAEIYSITDGTNIKGWDIEKNPREVGDVNGDGKKDLVGFGKDGVYVSLSNGSSFGSPVLWSKTFGSDAGWDANTVKHVGDANGDNKADIVAFAYDGTYVALSNGTGFGPLVKWQDGFGFNAGGWMPKHRRFVADVNGDKKVDVIGFGETEVYVALSSGYSFGAAQVWTHQFCSPDGWDLSNSLAVQDVNNDGRADIVGFGFDEVYVAKSTGTMFAPAESWTGEFGNWDGWEAGTYRMVGDFNGDKKADIIAISTNDVWVALSTGSLFQSGKILSSGYGINDGFDLAAARMVGDVSGDGKADLVVCNTDKVHVGKSAGTSFNSDAIWFRWNYALNTNEWFAP